jgi:hypothetical protein
MLPFPFIACSAEIRIKNCCGEENKEQRPERQNNYNALRHATIKIVVVKKIKNKGERDNNYNALKHGIILFSLGN